MQIDKQLLIARNTLLNLNEELAGYRIYFMGDKFREDTTVQVHEILSRILILKDQVETALESVTMPFKVQVAAGELNPGDKAFLIETNPEMGMEETLDWTCTYIGQEKVLFEYVKQGKQTRTTMRNKTEIVWKLR